MSQTPRELTALIRERIHAMTCGRIRELAIHVDADSVEVHGLAPTFHVKQLALCAVRKLLPTATVRNRLQVPAT